MPGRPPQISTQPPQQLSQISQMNTSKTQVETLGQPHIQHESAAQSAEMDKLLSIYEKHPGQNRRSRGRCASLSQAVEQVKQTTNKKKTKLKRGGGGRGERESHNKEVRQRARTRQ